MMNSGLFGPFILDSESIDANVKGEGPGAYALGKYDKPNDTFYVSYVGRSDDDLNGRLHEHETELYSHFQYAFYHSEEAAFKNECELWHAFGGPTGKLDNKVHPARPAGKKLNCPNCRVFG
jgi:hypothetical protein